MKTTFSTQDTLKTSPGIVSSSFNINTNAHTFRLLSANMYSNPIRAIIREIGTNCLDAHVLNGHRGAFDVTAPCSYNPFVAFRDYGPGLDHDGIMDLYCTYFGTDKNESNDFIGAMGLGAKAPLGFTDMFTVTSYHKGIATEYSVYFDQERLPQVAKIFSEPSDEPSGLHIVIPAAGKDDVANYRTWEQEIIDVYKWFPKGSVNVIEDGDSINSMIELEHGKFTSYDINGVTLIAHNERSIDVQMGSIAYPVKVQQLKTTKHKIQQHRTGYAISVDIGDVNFTPSREEMYYDTHTVKVLTDKYDKLYDHLRQYIDNECKRCTSIITTEQVLETKIPAEIALLSNIFDVNITGEIIQYATNAGFHNRYINLTNSGYSLHAEQIAKKFNKGLSTLAARHSWTGSAVKEVKIAKYDKNAESHSRARNLTRWKKGEITVVYHDIRGRVMATKQYLKRFSATFLVLGSEQEFNDFKAMAKKINVARYFTFSKISEIEKIAEFAELNKPTQPKSKMAVKVIGVASASYNVAVTSRRFSDYVAAAGGSIEKYRFNDACINVLAPYSLVNSAKKLKRRADIAAKVCKMDQINVYTLSDTNYAKYDKSKFKTIEEATQMIDNVLSDRHIDVIRAIGNSSGNDSYTTRRGLSILGSYINQFGDDVDFPDSDLRTSLTALCDLQSSEVDGLFFVAKDEAAESSEYNVYTELFNNFIIRSVVSMLGSDHYYYSSSPSEALINKCKETLSLINRTLKEMK